VYSAIPLGSGLMSFRFLQVLVAFVRTGELPRHDHSHVEGVETKELLVELNSEESSGGLRSPDLDQRQLDDNAKSEGTR
jgi:C4-dicarboxylate transporter, DctQ subunit